MKQSNRWYFKDGSVCFEIQKADGKGMRKPTIKDARLLDLVPSVTTVANIIKYTGLEIWKDNQILEAAWKNRADDITFEAWTEKILEQADEVSSTAATTGGDIHDAIDHYLKTGKFEGKYEAWQRSFFDWWRKQDWYEKLEKMLTEQHIPTDFGYGGRFDIWVEPNIVIDIKTQDSKGKPFNFYRSWGRQLSAYAQALKADRLISVVLDSKEPTKIGSCEWSKEYPVLLEEFKATLLLWGSENNWKQNS